MQNQLCSHSQASQFAAMLAGSYRRDEASDPEIYAMRLAIEFQKYPARISETVAMNLPAKIKWLPSIAEIHDALESEMAPVYRAAREKLAKDDRAKMLGTPDRLPEADRAATVAAMKARHGENFGLVAKNAEKRELSAVEAQAALDRHAALAATGEMPVIPISDALKKIIANWAYAE